MKKTASKSAEILSTDKLIAEAHDEMTANGYEITLRSTSAVYGQRTNAKGEKIELFIDLMQNGNFSVYTERDGVVVGGPGHYETLPKNLIEYVIRSIDMERYNEYFIRYTVDEINQTGKQAIFTVNNQIRNGWIMPNGSGIDYAGFGMVCFMPEQMESIDYQPLA